MWSITLQIPQPHLTGLCQHIHHNSLSVVTHSPSNYDPVSLSIPELMDSASSHLLSLLKSSLY